MSVRKKLQVSTELSLLDLGNLYISLQDIPSKDSVCFNFTIDDKTGGFIITREDWIKIINYIENEINNG